MSTDGSTDGSAAPSTPERPGAAPWVPAGTPDVAALREAAPGCRGCELWEPATQVVFSAGNPSARVALVGEQPGDAEDTRGVPFVGPAGRLLQQAVAEAGLDREDLYVTNAVKHFRFTPRGKRRIHATPEAAHVSACKPWLAAELQAVAPEVVVCLGATAVRSLLGTAVKVTKDRGVPIHRGTTRGDVVFLVTMHPSAVLRMPEEAREAGYGDLVRDLRVVADLVGAASSSPGGPPGASAAAPSGGDSDAA